MDVGGVVRRARLERGLSQAALAGRAGTSQPAIARLEAGRTSPSVDTLERLFGALGMRMEIRGAEIEPGVDRTLIAQALRRTPRERLRRMAEAARGIARLRAGMRRARR